MAPLSREYYLALALTVLFNKIDKTLSPHERQVLIDAIEALKLR
jgi:hypothetical protein